MTSTADRDALIVTAFWETKPGEEQAVADILKSFQAKAQKEPWVRQFTIHQSTTKPQQFFFYEVFKGDGGFADHQQTEHFKTLIQGQALPKLARREREQYRFV